jgi:hypothetical protein
MKLIFKVCLVIGVALVVSVPTIWYLYPKPIIQSENFETGFNNWMADADVPMDPNNSDHRIAWNISRVATQAYSGQYSAALFIDGKQDDGTVWIERKISVENNSEIRVKITFQLYSEQVSFNTIAGVCAYVGLSNPEEEADFEVIGNANEAAGWKAYSHTTTLNTGSNGEIWVAAGITVRWETQMTYNVDDVEIIVS